MLEMTKQILRHYNGRICVEQYQHNKLYHHLTRPAYKVWNKEGVLIHEAWYKDNQYHREDGPAYRRWNNYGKLTVESWYFEGLKHRLEGPSEIKLSKKNFVKEHWWLNGRRYTNNTHPFIVCLKQYRLYSKWRNNELTDDERVLIKLCIR